MRSDKELMQKRRKNANLYPIYKMISWDLLFFYSVEFLFLTIVKNISASEILVIKGFYLIFTMLMQIPAVTITDFLGKRKSIILGNVMLIFYILILINLPGATSVILANLVFALGYDIKDIAETNLLYDSVATKGGDGLYAKLDSRGGSFYYILDGVASLLAGYLFVINNYLPMYICLSFIVLSTILSFGFEDIYVVKPNKRKSFFKNLKKYGKDLKTTIKFIIKSKRMKAFIMFQIAFYSVVTIIEIYQSNLLVEIGIKEEQFSMIFAILTLISGISISLREGIEKKFKNRTLTFIGLIYVFAIIFIGLIVRSNIKAIIVPVVLIMYVVQSIAVSIWYILESKYIKNFTTENERNKIAFTYNFIGALAASIASIFGGLLLEIISIQNAFLIIGLLWFVFIILALDYMRTRFGLKPEKYDKKDIQIL